MRHLDRGKQLAKPGALNFVVLFFGISLGHKDEAVTSPKLTQRLFNSGEEFDLVVGNCLRKRDDARVFLGCYGAVGKLLEAVDQRAAKALQTVAILGDGRTFAGIQVLPDLLAGVNTVIEVGDEAGDGADYNSGFCFTITLVPTGTRS